MHSIIKLMEGLPEEEQDRCDAIFTFDQMILNKSNTTSSAIAA
jgi:hypothetical protein